MYIQRSLRIGGGALDKIVVPTLFGSIKPTLVNNVFAFDEDITGTQLILVVAAENGTTTRHTIDFTSNLVDDVVASIRDQGSNQQLFPPTYIFDAELRNEILEIRLVGEGLHFIRCESGTSTQYLGLDVHPNPKATQKIGDVLYQAQSLTRAEDGVGSYVVKYEDRTSSSINRVADSVYSSLEHFKSDSDEKPLSFKNSDALELDISGGMINRVIVADPEFHIAPDRSGIIASMETSTLLEISELLDLHSSAEYRSRSQYYEKLATWVEENRVLQPSKTGPLEKTVSLFSSFYNSEGQLVSMSDRVRASIEKDKDLTEDDTLVSLERYLRYASVNPPIRPSSEGISSNGAVSAKFAGTILGPLFNITEEQGQGPDVSGNITSIDTIKLAYPVFPTLDQMLKGQENKVVVLTSHGVFSLESVSLDRFYIKVKPYIGNINDFLLNPRTPIERPLDLPKGESVSVFFFVGSTLLSGLAYDIELEQRLGLDSTAKIPDVFSADILCAQESKTVEVSNASLSHLQRIKLLQALDPNQGVLGLLSSASIESLNSVALAKDTGLLSPDREFKAQPSNRYEPNFSFDTNLSAPFIKELYCVPEQFSRYRVNSLILFGQGNSTGDLLLNYNKLVVRRDASQNEYSGILKTIYQPLATSNLRYAANYDSDTEQGISIAALLAEFSRTAYLPPSTLEGQTKVAQIINAVLDSNYLSLPSLSSLNTEYRLNQISSIYEALTKVLPFSALDSQHRYSINLNKGILVRGLTLNTRFDSRDIGRQFLLVSPSHSSYTVVLEEVKAPGLARFSFVSSRGFAEIYSEDGNSLNSVRGFKLEPVLGPRFSGHSQKTIKDKLELSSPRGRFGQYGVLEATKSELPPLQKQTIKGSPYLHRSNEYETELVKSANKPVYIEILHDANLTEDGLFENPSEYLRKLTVKASVFLKLDRLSTASPLNMDVSLFNFIKGEREGRDFSSYEDSSAYAFINSADATSDNAVVQKLKDFILHSLEGMDSFFAKGLNSSTADKILLDLPISTGTLKIGSDAFRAFIGGSRYLLNSRMQDYSLGETALPSDEAINNIVSLVGGTLGITTPNITADVLKGVNGPAQQYAAFEVIAILQRIFLSPIQNEFTRAFYRRAALINCLSDLFSLDFYSPCTDKEVFLALNLIHNNLNTIVSMGGTTYIDGSDLPDVSISVFGDPLYDQYPFILDSDSYIRITSDQTNSSYILEDAYVDASMYPLMLVAHSELTGADRRYNHTGGVRTNYLAKAPLVGLEVTADSLSTELTIDYTQSSGILPVLMFMNNYVPDAYVMNFIGALIKLCEQGQPPIVEEYRKGAAGPVNVYKFESDGTVYQVAVDYTILSYAFPRVTDASGIDVTDPNEGYILVSPNMEYHCLLSEDPPQNLMQSGIVFHAQNGLGDPLTNNYRILPYLKAELEGYIEVHSQSARECLSHFIMDSSTNDFQPSVIFGTASHFIKKKRVTATKEEESYNISSPFSKVIKVTNSETLNTTLSGLHANSIEIRNSAVSRQNLPLYTVGFSSKVFSGSLNALGATFSNAESSRFSIASPITDLKSTEVNYNRYALLLQRSKTLAAEFKSEGEAAVVVSNASDGSEYFAHGALSVVGDTHPDTISNSNRINLSSRARQKRASLHVLGSSKFQGLFKLTADLAGSRYESMNLMPSRDILSGVHGNWNPAIATRNVSYTKYSPVSYSLPEKYYYFQNVRNEGEDTYLPSPYTIEQLRRERRKIDKTSGTYLPQVNETFQASVPQLGEQSVQLNLRVTFNPKVPVTFAGAQSTLYPAVLPFVLNGDVTEGICVFYYAPYIENGTVKKYDRLFFHTTKPIASFGKAAEGRTVCFKLGAEGRGSSPYMLGVIESIESTYSSKIAEATYTNGVNIIVIKPVQYRFTSADPSVPGLVNTFCGRDSDLLRLVNGEVCRYTDTVMVGRSYISDAEGIYGSYTVDDVYKDFDSIVDAYRTNGNSKALTLNAFVHGKEWTLNAFDVNISNKLALITDTGRFTSNLFSDRNGDTHIRGNGGNLIIDGFNDVLIEDESGHHTVSVVVTCAMRRLLRQHSWQEYICQLNTDAGHTSANDFNLSISEQDFYDRVYGAGPTTNPVGVDHGLYAKIHTDWLWDGSEQGIISTRDKGLHGTKLDNSGRLKGYDLKFDYITQAYGEHTIPYTINNVINTLNSRTVAMNITFQFSPVVHTLSTGETRTVTRLPAGTRYRLSSDRLVRWVPTDTELVIKAGNYSVISGSDGSLTALNVLMTCNDLTAPADVIPEGVLQYDYSYQFINLDGLLDVNTVFGSDFIIPEVSVIVDATNPGEVTIDACNQLRDDIITFYQDTLDEFESGTSDDVVVQILGSTSQDQLRSEHLEEYIREYEELLVYYRDIRDLTNRLESEAEDLFPAIGLERRDQERETYVHTNLVVNGILRGRETADEAEAWLALYEGGLHDPGSRLWLEDQGYLDSQGNITDFAYDELNYSQAAKERTAEEYSMTVEEVEEILGGRTCAEILGDSNYETVTIDQNSSISFKRLDILRRTTLQELAGTDLSPSKKELPIGLLTEDHWSNWFGTGDGYTGHYGTREDNNALTELELEARLHSYRTNERYPLEGLLNCLGRPVVVLPTGVQVRSVNVTELSSTGALNRRAGSASERLGAVPIIDTNYLAKINQKVLGVYADNSSRAPTTEGIIKSWSSVDSKPHPVTAEQTLSNGGLIFPHGEALFGDHNVEYEDGPYHYAYHSLKAKFNKQGFPIKSPQVGNIRPEDYMPANRWAFTHAGPTYDAWFEAYSNDISIGKKEYTGGSLGVLGRTTGYFIDETLQNSVPLRISFDTDKLAGGMGTSLYSQNNSLSWKGRLPNDELNERTIAKTGDGEYGANKAVNPQADWIIRYRIDLDVNKQKPRKSGYIGLANLDLLRRFYNASTDK